MNVIKKYQDICGIYRYLTEKSVALALCDNGVPIEEKSLMLLAMNTVYEDEEPAKRIKID